MIKTGLELAQAAQQVAEHYKTLYVFGCIGAPLNSANKQRYKRAQAYNRRSDRAAKIDAAGADTFGFDCVCFIKSLLWGWNGDTGKVYGGATYGSNGVPDWDANMMIRKCNAVSDRNWEHMRPGEVIWIPDHIGIYIGYGMAVECTARWDDGVQITAVHNIGEIPGRNGRTWDKHGQLPWISYEDAYVPNPVPESAKPAPAPAPAPDHRYDTTISLPVIKSGSKGSAARALQALLIGYGYSCGPSGADGIFGRASVAALKSWQQKNSLTADGICGRASWRKLLGN